jgi:hypothetical protein
VQLAASVERDRHLGLFAADHPDRRSDGDDRLTARLGRRQEMTRH